MQARDDPDEAGANRYGQGVTNARPLIVTASLSPEVFAYSDRLRRAHYPPERNVLSAHLTLFHAIPPSCERELCHLLADLAGEHRPLPARLSGIMSLGSGTALLVESPPLLDLRAQIAERFAGSLTDQDRHPPRLHITIQNKVSAREAKALQANLQADFMPRTFAIPALEAHFYAGGPWESAGRWPFRRAGKSR